MNNVGMKVLHSVLGDDNYFPWLVDLSMARGYEQLDEENIVL